MKKLSVLAVILSAVLLFSCNKGGGAYEKVDNPQSQAEIDQNALVDYLKTNNIEAQKTASGIYYTIETEGTGKQPTAQDIVEVHYKGTLLDGKEFDSSYKRNQTIAFPLANVIPGWKEGIPLLKEGGKGKLFIPSTLAYGPRGMGGAIPPNSPLVFEVELIKVLDEAGYAAKQEEMMLAAIEERTKPGREELGEKEDAEILKFIKKKGWKATKTKEGIYFVEDKKGDGTHPKMSNAVTVHYTGTLLNGKQFDTSKKGKNEPVTFPLTRVIPGWTMGIPQLSKGGKGKLIIPSYLAYGKQGRPSIPSNSILVFDVELIDIK